MVDVYNVCDQVLSTSGELNGGEDSRQGIKVDSPLFKVGRSEGQSDVGMLMVSLVNLDNNILRPVGPILDKNPFFLGPEDSLGPSPILGQGPSSSPGHSVVVETDPSNKSKVPSHDYLQKQLNIDDFFGKGVLSQGDQQS